MDPTTAQHVRETFYVGIGFMVLLAAWLYLGRRRVDHGPTRLDEWRERLREGRVVMSRAADREAPDQPVAAPVAPVARSAEQPIVMRDNADNASLPDNDLLPEEVREIIRFQAKVEGLANLYKSGQVTNLAKGIEEVFECSRSSKSESVYQRAKRAIDPLIARPLVITPIAGRSTSAAFAGEDREAL